MSDGSKGISLRKKKNKRPAISGPRPLPDAAPSTDGAGTDGNPYDNPQLVRAETSQSTLRGGRPPLGASATSDYVKRRHSTKIGYGIPMDDGPPPPMPAMPSIPLQYQTQMTQSPTKEEPVQFPGPKSVKLDIRALRDPNLVPEQYIAHNLGDADETDILMHQDELRKLKEHTNADMQHNVYQNRTQFIKISKEAEKLKMEMRTLRVLMTDLTSALHHAAQAAGAEVSNMSASDRKRANRSSVANLEALWSTHLQALWQRVEGSQKYLPAAPGRHILYESSRWVELNAATWKPRRRVHIILLNDHLLIAVEKKRVEAIPGLSPRLDGVRKVSGQQGSAPTTLVADRCFPLQDATIMDISRRPSTTTEDRSLVSNAISVRIANENFTFAIGSSSDATAEKSSLLVSYRKASESLRKAATPRDRPDSALMSPSLGPRSKPSTPLLGFSSSTIEVDGRPQPLRALETQLDNLDIDIALQRFDDAVNRCEKLRRTARGIKGSPSAAEQLGRKIDERAGRLGAVLARRLALGAAGRERTRETVGWMVRLGLDGVAVETFLSARGEALNAALRKLTFTGSLPPHVRALSYVTFTGVLHTLQIYNVAFLGPGYASAAVRWAKERVDEFNAALGRRLAGLPRESELRLQCIADAKEQCAVLRQVGVDFEGMVGEE